MENNRILTVTWRVLRLCNQRIKFAGTIEDPDNRGLDNRGLSHSTDSKRPSPTRYRFYLDPCFQRCQDAWNTEFERAFKIVHLKKKKLQSPFKDIKAYIWQLKSFWNISFHKYRCWHNFECNKVLMSRSKFFNSNKIARVPSGKCN